jgi:GMP synthase-like glutamine amidotransferase
MNSKDSFLVLQHAECEPPAAYQDELDDRGVSVHTVQLGLGERLPPPRAFDAIIAMGGPMSVNDEATFHWLAQEKVLIREFVANGGPYWGVCLGAQLLASSLAGKVYKGGQPEVGILPVRSGKAGRLDPVFSVLPSEFLALQWHTDTFDLPAGSVLLASSSAYRHQSFRWKRAYGLQFHLEASIELVHRWGEIPAYAQALESVIGSSRFPLLLDQLSEAAEVMRSHAVDVFRRWLDLIVTGESGNRR